MKASKVKSTKNSGSAKGARRFIFEKASSNKNESQFDYDSEQIGAAGYSLFG